MSSIAFCWHSVIENMVSYSRGMLFYFAVVFFGLSSLAAAEPPKGGFFDKEDHKFSINSRTFIFGSLVSSVLILNLNNHITLEEMKYLQATTECTKDTLEYHQTPFTKPFQNLNFLLRNWSNIEQFPFGLNDGNEIIMKSTENTNIMSSFENIDSFLVPFPGTVIRLKKSTGCWSEMDVEFKKQLNLLIEHILAPNRLVIKKVSGIQMTGSKLNENIKTHFNAIKSKVVVVKFTKVYKQNLAQIFGAADPKNIESFYSSHLSAKEQATALAMNSNPKLDLNWNEAFDKAFKELNYDKNKFKELNVTLGGDPLKHPYGEALNVMCFNGKDTQKILIKLYSKFS